MPFATGQITTDQFGIRAQAEAFYNLLVNGRSVLSQDQLLREVTGPNESGGFQLGPVQISHVFSLQFGAVNTIELRMGIGAFGINEVNEVPGTGHGRIADLRPGVHGRRLEETTEDGRPINNCPASAEAVN